MDLYESNRNIFRIDSIRLHFKTPINYGKNLDYCFNEIYPVHCISISSKEWSIVNIYSSLTIEITYETNLKS